MIKKFICLVLIINIFSCASMYKLNLQSELDKAAFTGKVISEEGLPLEGVKVKLNTGINALTDINGKFFFSVLPYGKYSIIFEKTDYSKEETKFEYTIKSKKPLYLVTKMVSYNYLLNLGSDLLKTRNYEEIEKVIKKIEGINSDEDSFLYLKATYLFSKRMYAESIPLYEELIARDRKNVYFQLPLITVYDKLEKYEKKAEVCAAIARINPKEYLDLLKISAGIYRDKLNDNEMCENIMKEYRILSEKE